MQDSSMDSPQQGTPQQGTPQQGTPQQEIPRYETLQQGTPQQATPRHDTPRYNTPRYNVPPKRPLGVTILSILIGIGGLAALLLGILFIGLFAAIGHNFGVSHPNLRTAFDIIGWILGILPLVIGIIYLAVAIGLWLLKSWAFWTTVVVSAIFLLRQVYQWFQPRDSYTLIIIFTIIPVVILLYLLLDPNVRRAFHIGGAGLERLT